jgi:hypothetical protein
MLKNRGWTGMSMRCSFSRPITKNSKAKRVSNATTKVLVNWKGTEIEGMKKIGPRKMRATRHQNPIVSKMLPDEVSDP